MKLLLLPVIFFILATVVSAQGNVRNTTLSDKYDLIAKQSNCRTDWRGRMCDETLQMFRKKARRPFQSISIRGGDEPPIFDDFNFDGHRDLAICDGMNGVYITPSYRVYLYSKSRAKFVFNSSFTSLSQGPAMGFFEVDKRKKTLTTATKMGFGYFTQRKYDVYDGKPRLIYELIHDESSAEGIWAVITTKKLTRWKWRTWWKRERIPPTPTKLTEPTTTSPKT